MYDAASSLVLQSRLDHPGERTLPESTIVLTFRSRKWAVKRRTVTATRRGLLALGRQPDERPASR
jgi:hypothetical protein